MQIKPALRFLFLNENISFSLSLLAVFRVDGLLRSYKRLSCCGAEELTKDTLETKVTGYFKSTYSSSFLVKINV